MEAIDFRHWEFKIVEGDASDVQKTLNQWRHTYFLKVLQINIDRDTMYACVARQEINKHL